MLNMMDETPSLGKLAGSWTVSMGKGQLVCGEDYKEGEYRCLGHTGGAFGGQKG